MSEQQVTCKRCGWVYFAVSREEAERAAAGFADSEMFLNCWRCGGTEFRPAEPGDCPAGATITGVFPGALER